MTYKEWQKIRRKRRANLDGVKLVYEERTTFAKLSAKKAPKGTKRYTPTFVTSKATKVESVVTEQTKLDRRSFQDILERKSFIRVSGDAWA